MHIFGNSAAYEFNPLQALGKIFHQPAQPGVQNPPSGDSTGDTPATPAAPMTPPPSPGRQFASQTLSALLGVQQDSQGPGSAATDLAGKLIAQVDTDGDGQLTSGEIGQALGIDPGDGRANALDKAFAKLDQNGDEKLSSDELATGLQHRMGQFGAHGPHRHGEHRGVSSSDLADQIVGTGDADKDGSLSQSELAGVLGQAGLTMSSDDLATAFGKLDANGDGLLSGAELAAAIDKLREERRGTQTASAADTAATSQPPVTPPPADPSLASSSDPASPAAA